jgi:hypothetical protein
MVDGLWIMDLLVNYCTTVTNYCTEPATAQKVGLLPTAIYKYPVLRTTHYKLHTTHYTLPTTY